MTIEELHKLFKSSEKRKSKQLVILEQYFPYFAGSLAVIRNEAYKKEIFDIKRCNRRWL